MTRRHVISAVLVTCVCASAALAQNAVSASAPTPDAMLSGRPLVVVKTPTNESIALEVPKGTAVQVILDKELRVQKVGQSVHGRIAEPVYAFDKLVVPVGTKVTGQITHLEGVSGGRRILDALNADFSPPRKLQIEFDDLELTDGRHIPIHTTATPGSGQVIQFVTSADDEKKKGVKDAASEKADQAKEEAKREWDSAIQQVKEPGKVHKIERYAVAQLPVHPQYIYAGTVYLAELQQPLDFGSEPLTPQLAASLSFAPPDGSFVRARLVTPLSSATSQKDDKVEAMLARPLFDGDRLILPQGAILRGSVVQVEPARHMSRNGQLRFVFHDLILPSGLDQKVSAVLAGVQAGKTDNLKLDSEGGAQATSPKSRYLQTGIALGLAAVSATGDGDVDILNKSAGGANGFKLVGIAVGIAARSNPLGIAMGALGASRSVYIHFIARGRDVVFPENTAMQIGIGVRPVPSEMPTQQ
jgi:hypothetical protein